MSRLPPVSGLLQIAQARQDMTIPPTRDLETLMTDVQDACAVGEPRELARAGALLAVAIDVMQAEPAPPRKPRASRNGTKPKR